MNGLDEFLQKDVKEFREEIERLDDILEKVVPTFGYQQVSRCSGKMCPKGRDSGRCPFRKKRLNFSFAYGITEYGEINSSIISDWSTSTNAMLLNLASYLRYPDFKSCLIEGSRTLVMPDQVRHKIRSEGLKDDQIDNIFKLLEKCFETEHNKRSGALKKGFHDSGSYGPNPCSSLVWIGELILHNIQKLKKKKDDDIIIYKKYIKKEEEYKKLAGTWFDIVVERIQDSFKEDGDKIFPAGIDGMRAAYCYKLLRLIKKDVYFCDNGTDRKKPEDKKTWKDRKDIDFYGIERLIKDKLRPIFLQRIYQHITSFEISDGLFDPGELAFSMEGLTILDENNHYIQEVLLNRFFETMRQSFFKDVFWKPIKPMNYKDQGSVLLPLSVEVGNSLLRICKHVSGDPQKLNWFHKNKDMFVDYTKWAINQVVAVHTRHTVPEMLMEFVSLNMNNQEKKIIKRLKELHVIKTAKIGVDPLVEIVIKILKKASVISFDRKKIKLKSLKRFDDYQKKTVLLILFPFFSEELRKDLYFALCEDKDGCIRGGVQRAISEHLNTIQPIVYITYTLLLLSRLSEKIIEFSFLGEPNKNDELYCRVEQYDRRMFNAITQEIGSIKLKEKWKNFYNEKTVSNKKPIKRWYGWHSDHVMQPLYNSRLIHLWATREYFIYLMQYRAMRCQDMAWELIQKNGFKVDLPRHPKWYLKNVYKKEGVKEIKEVKIIEWDDSAPPKPQEYWEDTIKPGFELLIGDEMKGLNVYNKIYSKDSKDNKNFLNREDPDNCKWSMLLYGPPGTGKTTIAEKLAETLQWPLITITPSDFIRKGGSMVEARAKQIFQSLELMQDMVVLFDELDRLILDRDAPMYLKQEDIFQFMTPGMLVKLRDLWKAKRVIFVICTNYEERIDPAAKRKGRIDESFLVLPPDWIGRLRILVREFIKGYLYEKEIYKNDLSEKKRILILITGMIDLLKKEDQVKPNMCDENKWSDLKRRTFGYAIEDLKNLADQCLARLKNNKKISHNINEIINKNTKFEIRSEIKEIMGELLNVISMKKLLESPTIRIESWLHRFKPIDEKEKEKEFQTTQQPFDEVLGLCAMNPSFKCGEALKNAFKDNTDVKKTLIKMLENYFGRKDITKNTKRTKVHEWTREKDIKPITRLDFLIDIMPDGEKTKCTSKTKS